MSDVTKAILGIVFFGLLMFASVYATTVAVSECQADGHSLIYCVRLLSK